MGKDELMDQLDADIRTTERSLIFWRHQANLQTEEPFGEIVEAQVKRLETTMALLLNARDTLEDA